MNLEDFRAILEPRLTAWIGDYRIIKGDKATGKKAVNVGIPLQQSGQLKVVGGIELCIDRLEDPDPKQIDTCTWKSDSMRIVKLKNVDPDLSQTHTQEAIYEINRMVRDGIFRHGRKMTKIPFNLPIIEEVTFYLVHREDFI